MGSKNKINKLNIFLIFLFLPFLYGYTNLNGTWDDIVFDDTDFDNITLEEEAIGEIIQASSSQCDFLDLIINTLKINEALKKPFYEKTNSVLSRELHDLPIFRMKQICPADKFRFSVSPFYNQTSKMYLSKNSYLISSYINLLSGGFINTLIENLDEDYAALDLMDVAEILPLFAGIKLQERRAGIYLGGQIYKNCWNFRFGWPIYYLERNFFVTEEEQDAISHAPFIRSFSAGSNGTVIRNFLTEHLVSDKITFLGDLRFEFLYNVCNKNCIDLRVGGLLTLPTATSFKNGMIGGYFYKGKVYPSVNLEEIGRRFNNAIDDNPVDKYFILNSLQDTGINSLDSLASKVTEAPLGNYFNIGGIIEWDYFFDNNLQWCSRFSVKQFLPRKDIRFFIAKPPASFPEVDLQKCDPIEIMETYIFYDQALYNLLFPPHYTVKVYPGTEIQFTTYLRNIRGCFEAYLGYDFWWRSKEKIKFPYEKPQIPIFVTPALNPSMIQHKILGGLSYKFPYFSGEVDIGLRADCTFANKGIGKDFSLAFAFGYSF